MIALYPAGTHRWPALLRANGFANRRTAGFRGQGEPDERLPARSDAWFAHVEQHPYTSGMLFQDAAGDRDIQALQRELRNRQRAADVVLLREFAPQLPEAELEPLGEIIRSSLTGLALWWLDNPAVPRAVVVAAMLRVTRGLPSTAR